MVSKYPVLYWRIAFGLCVLLSFIRPLRTLSFAEEPVPDWTTWKCKNPIISFSIIETRECHPLGNIHSDCVILELKGDHIPFLIGWGRDELAENPGANAYTAIYKRQMDCRCPWNWVYDRREESKLSLSNFFSARFLGSGTNRNENSRKREHYGTIITITAP